MPASSQRPNKLELISCDDTVVDLLNGDLERRLEELLQLVKNSLNFSFYSKWVNYVLCSTLSYNYYFSLQVLALQKFSIATFCRRLIIILRPLWAFDDKNMFFTIP